GTAWSGLPESTATPDRLVRRPFQTVAAASTAPVPYAVYASAVPGTPQSVGLRHNRHPAERFRRTQPVPSRSGAATAWQVLQTGAGWGSFATSPASPGIAILEGHHR